MNCSVLRDFVALGCSLPLPHPHNRRRGINLEPQDFATQTTLNAWHSAYLASLLRASFCVRARPRPPSSQPSICPSVRPSDIEKASRGFITLTNSTAFEASNAGSPFGADGAVLRLSVRDRLPIQSHLSGFANMQKYLRRCALAFPQGSPILPSSSFRVVVWSGRNA